MKKSILYSAVALAMVAAGSSCSSDYDIYPEEYAQVLMIKDAGEHAMTVYSTDTKVPFAVTIFKGGHTKGEATVTLRSMTSDEFAEYQLESGKPYQAISADCFSFSETEQTSSVEVKIGADESYKVVNVYVNAEEVGDFLESFDNSLYSAVIPVKIESDNTIDTDGVNTFIVPTYSVPTLAFDADAMTNNMRGFNLKNGVFTTTVTLPIENLWDISFNIEYAPELVEGTGYTAIPESAISGLDQTITMNAGQSSVDVTLNIDASKITNLTTDAMPLRIVNVNVDGIEVDDANGWMVVDTQIRLTAGMLSSNAEEPYEGSLAFLLDDDLSTYFHSAYSWNVGDYHYLQVNLPSAYSQIVAMYCNRADGNIQGDMAFCNFYTGTSNDNLKLFKFFNYDEGLNHGVALWTTLAPAPFETPQSVFRFESLGTWTGKVYFVMTEFRMYGI